VRSIAPRSGEPSGNQSIKRACIGWAARRYECGACSELIDVTQTGRFLLSGDSFRNEIEDREAGKLEAATDYAASVIAARHGSGEVAAKIQAQVIVAAV